MENQPAYLLCGRFQNKEQGDILSINPGELYEVSMVKPDFLNEYLYLQEEFIMQKKLLHYESSTRGREYRSCLLQRLVAVEILRRL